MVSHSPHFRRWFFIQIADVVNDLTSYSRIVWGRSLCDLGICCSRGGCVHKAIRQADTQWTECCPDEGEWERAAAQGQLLFLHVSCTLTTTAISASVRRHARQHLSSPLSCTGFQTPISAAVLYGFERSLKRVRQHRRRHTGGAVYRCS